MDNLEQTFPQPEAEMGETLRGAAGERGEENRDEMDKNSTALTRREHK